MKKLQQDLADCIIEYNSSIMRDIGIPDIIYLDPQELLTHEGNPSRKYLMRFQNEEVVHIIANEISCYYNNQFIEQYFIDWAENTLQESEFVEVTLNNMVDCLVYLHEKLHE